MIVLEILAYVFAYLLALAVFIPALVLAGQVLAALVPARRASPPTGPRPGLAVLIPAHDEASGIGATLAALRPQLGPADRLLVVADNCGDATASIARVAGAEVVERTDARRRGKGYALDFGVRHLAADPRAVVVIVDADCRVEAGALERLALACAASGGPVQALYLMHAPTDAGLKQRIAEFAWRVKNWVRPLGMHRLGLPCQLTGTGMAFPWDAIARAELASGHIVEDMKLGIDLALAGLPPRFCPEAEVSSVFPDSAAASTSQRTRWEHGHLGMILYALPRLLRRAFTRGDAACLALALDLAVPPLALLVVLLAAVMGLSMVVVLLGLAEGPAVLAALGALLLLMAVSAAWLGWGRSVLPFAALLSVPFYVLAKLPLYLKFLTRRQQEWVRTDRD